VLTRAQDCAGALLVPTRQVAGEARSSNGDAKVVTDRRTGVMKSEDFMMAHKGQDRHRSLRWSKVWV